MEKCTHCDKKSNCHLNSSVLCDSHYNKEFKKNHIKDMIRHVINMISKKKEENTLNEVVIREYEDELTNLKKELLMLEQN